ncbi:MAG TPA: DUF6152 family protein [Steroidobacteraceae bacterium]|nr:DUF6152 family protein [Steroidobacteraceae bacterium]
MGRVSRVLASLAASALAASAYAHHSTAMFDMSQKVTLQGTVKELQWTNPHAWLQVLVPDENGNPVEWGVEMGTPAAMLREGWRPGSVMPGDKITVVVMPLKSGMPGGSLVSATRADGTVIGGLKP